MNIVQSLLSKSSLSGKQNVEIIDESKTNNKFIITTNDLCLQDETTKKQQVEITEMLTKILVYFKKENYTKARVLDLLQVNTNFCYHGENNNAEHIERVMLLACVIGFDEGLTAKDVEILIQGVKFHDIGRLEDDGKISNASQCVFVFKKKVKESDLLPGQYEKVLNILASQDLTMDKAKKTISHHGFCGISDFKNTLKIIHVFNDAHKLDKIRYNYKNIHSFSKNELVLQSSKNYINATFQLNNIYETRKLKAMNKN